MIDHVAQIDSMTRTNGTIICSTRAEIKLICMYIQVQLLRHDHVIDQQSRINPQSINLPDSDHNDDEHSNRRGKPREAIDRSIDRSRTHPGAGRAAAPHGRGGGAAFDAAPPPFLRHADPHHLHDDHQPRKN